VAAGHTTKLLHQFVVLGSRSHDLAEAFFLCKQNRCQSVLCDVIDSGGANGTGVSAPYVLEGNDQMFRFLDWQRTQDMRYYSRMTIDRVLQRCRAQHCRWPPTKDTPSSFRI
jgi:2-hydroxy-3-oxopropionate reductase